MEGYACGPHGSIGGEPELLASCYRRSIELAASRGLKSIAFPGISTGVYAYPVAAAARMAVSTVRKATASAPGVEEVIFCCFSEGDLVTYEPLLRPS